MRFLLALFAIMVMLGPASCDSNAAAPSHQKQVQQNRCSSHRTQNCGRCNQHRNRYKD